jgi:hypothetical protein
MQIANFLNKENVNTLWDVISDEDIFKSLHRDAQSQILQVFSTNIKGFFENEKTKTNNLIDINKKYIMLILNYIKTNFSQQKHNKIKILEESPVKELITYEEIQNDRKSQFEKDLGRLQEEFTNSMTLPVPEVPTFADKYEDRPISEMDKMIKEMTAKRNYEVEQINRNYQDANNATNWLQPQETSIKTDKFAPQKQSEEFNQTNSRVKYLNTLDLTNNNNDMISLNSPKKNVTWGKNAEIDSNVEDNYTNTHTNTHINTHTNTHTNTHINTDMEENIFKKLKRVGNADIAKLDENITENRIIKIEGELTNLHKKMDFIIDLLKQNK